MAAQYMITDGLITHHASTPNNVIYDSLTDGNSRFYCFRVKSADVIGSGDEQSVASMWRGSASTNLSFRFSLLTDGKIQTYIRESGATEDVQVSGVVTTDKSIGDNDDFWFGMEISMATGAQVQMYWGGTGGAPVWETYGAQSGPVVGVINIRSDAGNLLLVGDSRYATGPEDHWNGRIYEFLIFNGTFAALAAGSLVPDAWFNAEDFVVGDGNTDTATSASAQAEVWTLASQVTMIADDATVDAGGTQWWLAGTAVSTGTLSTEAGVVAGGQTIILTLTDDTWVATVGADNAITTALIAGLDAAQVEAGGWDAIVRPLITFADVVRTSATVVTITLPAAALYAVTADELVTATIPATALTAATEIVATSPLTITDDPDLPAGGGASAADLGVSRSSGAARRRIVDLDDPRRKYRLPY